MEIITLVENLCSENRLRAEFGLSLLIRVAQKSILFDMGASSLFAENAEILGVDLSNVDCAVLSHAHYDHGGGLLSFLHKNHSAPIYHGWGADGDYYGNIGARMPLFLEPLLHPLIKTSVRFSRYIGLEHDVLQQYDDRFIPVAGREEILGDVFVLSEIIRKYPQAEGNKYLLKAGEGGLSYDEFEHELILVVRESDGLTMFTGCGHRGILNMVETVQNAFEGEHIRAVVGGFHLALQPGKPRIAGTRDDIAAIGRQLAEHGVERILTGHCTGDDACAILQEQLGSRFARFSTGSCHIL